MSPVCFHQMNKGCFEWRGVFMARVLMHRLDGQDWPCGLRPDPYQ